MSYENSPPRASEEEMNLESSVTSWSPRSDVPKTREGLVADKLRQAILVGHFRPGEKLDQGVIAKQLEVSMSPLREAIRTLAAEGLISIYPHRGAVVTERSREELEELHLIRALLEGTAARLAVPHLDDARLARLKAILEAATETQKFDRIQLLNHGFHYTLYSACNQPQMLQLIAHLRNKVAPYIRLYLNAEKFEMPWADHRRIYEACVRRDATLVEEETRRHIQQVCAGILAALHHDVRTKEG
jgi:DNA-binding GntR family transcriptional regulator